MITERESRQSNAEKPGKRSMRTLLASILDRKMSAKLAPADARSAIERQQINTLRQSYKESCVAWKKFGVVTFISDGAHPEPPAVKFPQWEEIEAGLTPNILAAARQLKEPLLIAIPPIPFNYAVAALNRMAPPINCWPFNMYGLKQPTNMTEYNIDNPYDDCFKIWDTAPASYYRANNRSWRVAIVEGTKNVSPLKNQGHNISGNLNLARWALSEKGIKVIDNLQTYVSLLVMSLVKGDPIDTEGWTVLNAATAFHNGRYDYALAHFEENHAVFSRTRGGNEDSASWHLREMIRIPLKSD